MVRNEQAQVLKVNLRPRFKSQTNNAPVWRQIDKKPSIANASGKKNEISWIRLKTDSHVSDIFYIPTILIIFNNVKYSGMSQLLCSKSLPWLTDEVIVELSQHNVNNTADFLRTKNITLDDYCQLSLHQIDMTKMYLNSALENVIMTGRELIRLTRGKSNTIKTDIQSFDKLLCGGLRLGETLLVSHQYPQRNEIDKLIKKLSSVFNRIENVKIFKWVF